MLNQISALSKMEGYLTKRGSFFKTWRTRWFELSDNTLTYYKNQSKNVCKGSYILTEDTIVESFEEFQGKFIGVLVIGKSACSPC